MARALPLLAALAVASAGAVASAAAVADTPTPRERAQALLLNMTLLEKVSMLHGVGSDYTGATSGVPRLSIPPLLLNDGRQGFRPNDGSHTQTAFPCQLANVASWRRDLWYAFGNAMAEEFYGKGANVILAPMLILARVPQGGRNFESCGEDPVLAYHFARHDIAGEQSLPGVMANADDYILNNQETDRTSITAVCDPRTRIELYSGGYRGAAEGDVRSWMCSYNLVSESETMPGAYACENAITLGDLKAPEGLNASANSFVLSDWGGTHSTVNAAVAGLDMEMPGDGFFGNALVQAVEDGQIPITLVDDKVLRVLSAMFEQGIMDTPPSGGNPSTNVTSEAHNALARQLGAAGTVLLSNPRGVLPLTAASTKTVALIGDDGDLDPTCCGTGSGALFPPYVITPYQGISARAGSSSNVTYYPSPAIAVNITQFYSAERGDHFLDFTCEECFDIYVPVRSEGYAFRANFTGAVALLLYYNALTSSNLVTTADYPPSDPNYGYVRVLGYALPLNTSNTANTAVLELWTGLDTPTGQPVNSHRDFYTLASDASRAEAQALNYTRVAQLARVPTVPGGSPALDRVVAAAAAADVAIVCVSTTSGEGTDRASLSLAPEDDAMIAAVTAAQPNTVVVLHNPGAVVMPWADAAGAIVSAWFSGQEMGSSLADVLFGDVNPSARLPLTFPMTNEDTPLQTPLQYPGVNGTVVYSEGFLMGYRYWDSQGISPRFPFGHGLSYTIFSYSDLVVDTASASPLVVVNATVTNSGSRTGTEIAQLYLAFPPGWGEPPRMLRGFEALVDLAPGASAVASFTLLPRDRSIWNTTLYAWQEVPGEFGVLVGASSRDFRLQGSFTI